MKNELDQTKNRKWDSDDWDDSKFSPEQKLLFAKVIQHADDLIRWKRLQYSERRAHDRTRWNSNSRGRQAQRFFFGLQDEWCPTSFISICNICDLHMNVILEAIKNKIRCMHEEGND